MNLVGRSVKYGPLNRPFIASEETEARRYQRDMIIVKGLRRLNGSKSSPSFRLTPKINTHRYLLN